MANSTDKVLKKLQELEAGHAYLRTEMSKLLLSNANHGHQHLQSITPKRQLLPDQGRQSNELDVVDVTRKGPAPYTYRQWLLLSSESESEMESESSALSPSPSPDGMCLNILESLGQAAHVINMQRRIAYWNQAVEILYGYSASEALGKDAVMLMVDTSLINAAADLVKHVTMGESWIGQFPVKSKSGEQFLVNATGSPLFNDEGHLMGVVCISCDSRTYKQLSAGHLITDESSSSSSSSSSTNKNISTLSKRTSNSKSQVAIVSKFSHLVIKVTNKVRLRKSTSDKSMDRETRFQDRQYSKHHRNLSDYREDGTSDTNYEIPWEDLTLGENIGQGASGTVYHGLWMWQLKCSPSKTILMKPCFASNKKGSLFHLIQKNQTKLDWQRRICMAMDTVISHKVGDFGLSRIKHETYLSTKTGKGTPQWMAPEVIRKEPTNEKTELTIETETLASKASTEMSRRLMILSYIWKNRSDIYSFGVILWELVTEKIPWDDLNSMQVIGAVAFMNQRLEIPQGLHPELVSIIESCCHSDPKCRPTFHELLEKLKHLLKHADKLPKQHSTGGDSLQRPISNQRTQEKHSLDVEFSQS